MLYVQGHALSPNEDDDKYKQSEDGVEELVEEEEIEMVSCKNIVLIPYFGIFICCV